ncbi:hypothetical protein D3C72_2207170 [compost metagenome]
MVQPEQNPVSLQLRNNPQCLGPKLHLPESSPAAQHLHLYSTLEIKGDHTGFPNLMHIHQNLIRKQFLPFPIGHSYPNRIIGAGRCLRRSRINH